MTEVAKIAKKTRYVGSRSIKVIEFGTDRKGISDFLLAVTSNLFPFPAPSTTVILYTD